MTARYYLAGPMRGIKAFNFAEFDRVTYLLRCLGYEVFSPAERDLAIGFDPTDMDGFEDLAEHGFSLRDALGFDTAWICREADAVVVLDGWERSAGARAEVALARALSLPVYEWRTVESGHPVDITAPGAKPGLVFTDQVLERTDLANDEHRRTVSEVLRQGAAREGVSGTSSRFTRESPGPGRPRPQRRVECHEERITSDTGGSKGRKLAEMGAVDPSARMELARVAGFGARKYQRYNFLLGIDWSLSVDALHRHLMAWEAGEDRDDESGALHTAHVAWHALALVAFQLRSIGTDDRSTDERLDQIRVASTA